MRARAARATRARREGAPSAGLRALDVEHHARRGAHVDHVLSIGITRAPTVRDAADLVDRAEHALGEEEAEGQLSIVPRRPHRHRQRLTRHPHLERRLDRERDDAIRDRLEPGRVLRDAAHGHRAGRTARHGPRITDVDRRIERAMVAPAMATSQQKDDTIGFYLGLALFSVAIPIIAGVGYWMALNMRDVDRTTQQLTAQQPQAD
jgi:hypothetical protein